MKIIKKVISLIAIITIAIGALALTGCGKKDNSNESPLVGVWKGEEEYSDYGYEFNEDGTGGYIIKDKKIPFTFQDKGDNIRMTCTHCNSLKGCNRYTHYLQIKWFVLYFSGWCY